ncbi:MULTISPECIES: GntR family transcriptional regulator [Amycolatopsis]|uniref:GntR family transcriptional regulator n=1 Tax=Amycolatopsis albidoflavus TaxID=102226 RepID=A0ABW5I7P6_9PSEU
MSDVAYERLKEAIVRGEFEPGQKIRDADIAARLGLSRTPVREAIARLTDAGLVEAKPGVHTRITSLNRDDVVATLAVLQVLDELAVSTAVPRLTKEDLDFMSSATARLAHAVQTGNIEEALAADDDFHGVPIRAAANPVLARQIERLHPQLHRILYRKFSTLLGHRDTVGHHMALMEFCAQGDAEAAAKLSAEHWAHLGGLIEELFENDDLGT